MVKPPGNKNDDYIPWIVCRDASDHVGMKKLNAGHIDPLLIKLAEDVRRLRKDKGLSQEALALVADVDRTYVSQLERCVANPSIAILQRVADALGVSLAIELRAPSESVAD